MKIGPLLRKLRAKECRECRKMQELRVERYQRHTLISLFLMSRVSKRLFECTVQYNVLICISCWGCRKMHLDAQTPWQNWKYKACRECRNVQDQIAYKVTQNTLVSCRDCRKASFPSNYSVYSNSKSSNYNILRIKASNYTKLRIKPSNYNHFELNYM